MSETTTPGQQFQAIAWRHEDGSLYVREEGQGSEQDAGRVLRAAWKRYWRAREDLGDSHGDRSPEGEQRKRAELRAADDDMAAAVDFFDFFCSETVWKEYTPPQIPGSQAAS